MGLDLSVINRIPS